MPRHFGNALPDETSGYCPEFEVKKGIDGNWYAVFLDCYDCELAEDYFGDLPFASFGQFDNARKLTNVSTALKPHVPNWGR